MGTNLTLATDDNHSFGAYRADPDGEAKGGIVVIQNMLAQINSKHGHSQLNSKHGMAIKSIRGMAWRGNEI